ncbi:MAG: CDP-diacylglycerol--serine O-phosphatidyltransferase [Candidatus Omnitrophota bacterium]
MESARYMANVITAANLIFGATAIFLALMTKYVPAAWIIYLAILCDIADGKIARMGKELSEFGKQFDSLADLVSFVVAPAVLIFSLSRTTFCLWRLIACLIAVFCGTFRLARFNTENEDKQTRFFHGLPTPGFGAICASIVLISHKYNIQLESRTISAAVAILAIMMVSHIKYPSFKDKTVYQGKYLLAVVVMLIMLLFIPELTMFILCSMYVIFLPLRINLKEGRK